MQPSTRRALLRATENGFREGEAPLALPEYRGSVRLVVGSDVFGSRSRCTFGPERAPFGVRVSLRFEARHSTSGRGGEILLLRADGGEACLGLPEGHYFEDASGRLHA